MTKYFWLLVMGLLALPGQAVADDDRSDRSRDRLYTPTLWAEKPIYFDCNLTNIGQKTRAVRTRIINGNTGKVLLSQSVELAPRHTQDSTVAGLEAPGGPLYCEFTVRGSKKRFRGVAKLWGGPDAPNSSDITAIAAE